MGREDWYRRESWSQSDQERFFKRLARSRSGYNKAQYLRIQAYTLQTKASPPMFREALHLLDILLREHPHSAELGSAYLQRAQCLEAVGDLEGALGAFRLAVEADRADTGVQTNASLERALFIVRHGRSDLYEVALEDLERLEPHLVFPVTQYKIALAAALITWEQQDQATARRFARIALEAAGKRNSGLSYHPHVGLVEDFDPALHARLEEIAAE